MSFCILLLLHCICSRDDLRGAHQSPFSWSSWYYYDIANGFDALILYNLVNAFIFCYLQLSKLQLKFLMCFVTWLGRVCGTKSFIFVMGENSGHPDLVLVLLIFSTSITFDYYKLYYLHVNSAVSSRRTVEAWFLWGPGSPHYNGPSPHCL